MKKILVCQHVPHEPLGTLNPLLKKFGFRIRYVNFGRHPDLKPELDGYDGLVVLGGPMNVDQVEEFPHLKTEVGLIRTAINRGMPILGICLGAQLIAKALGEKIYANVGKEIGWYDVSLTEEGRQDPLFADFASTEKIFQWHGDTFDLPKGAVLLASSYTCRNQAFRYQDNVYGFQFHLEVDEPMVERWLKVPANKKELQELHGRFDPDHIRAETTLFIDRLKQMSEKVFMAFIHIFGPVKKGKMLPSK